MPDVISNVRKCIASGDFLDTRHSTDRENERNITRSEIVCVLKNGWHERSKDEYKERYKAWNYAIRGKTVDRRMLRVIVSFDENGMLIITAIDSDAD